MRLDLSDLRLFLSIVEAGSITAGAQAAHLALASASERLRSIEEHAGVRLLERRHRGVVTTEAGEALAQHARQMLRQRELLEQELQDFARGRRGSLQLLANTAALTEFLPGRLAPWLGRHPRVDVQLRERTSSGIVRTVAAGLAEAGIVSDAVDTCGLQVRPVAADHLVLIVPPGHRLAKGTSTSFADALREPWVASAPGSALHDHLEEHARRLGGSLDVRVRMLTFDGLCTMVAHGVGVGVIPRATARRLRRRHGFEVLGMQERWAQRRLCACYQDWKRLSPPMRSLLTHIGVEA
ncbi:LysR family transcriptional regulator [Xenophilus azovorans]|nr:LysR family transcriptional regulator [Xenophilus azovorans]